MTGWRLGWISPEALIPDLGKLIEYNTSCAPVFIQRAGVVAVTEGDALIAHTATRLRRARDFLQARLHSMPGIEAAVAPGAMYAFFRVEGVADSLAFCKRLVADAGLRPGGVGGFGPEGEGFLRWCFAASEARLADGAARLQRHLAGREHATAT